MKFMSREGRIQRVSADIKERVKPRAYIISFHWMGFCNVLQGVFFLYP
jgi:hypothetical protein